MLQQVIKDPSLTGGVFYFSPNFSVDHFGSNRFLKSSWPESNRLSQPIHRGPAQAVLHSTVARCLIASVRGPGRDTTGIALCSRMALPASSILDVLMSPSTPHGEPYLPNTLSLHCFAWFSCTEFSILSSSRPHSSVSVKSTASDKVEIEIPFSHVESWYLQLTGIGIPMY